MGEIERIASMIKSVTIVLLSELWLERKNIAIIEIIKKSDKKKKESQTTKITLSLGNEKAHNFLQAMVLCGLVLYVEKNSERKTWEMKFDFFNALGGYRIIRADPSEKHVVKDLVGWIIDEPLPLSLISDLETKFEEFREDLQEIAREILKIFPGILRLPSEISVNLRKPMKIKRKHQPELTGEVLSRIFQNYATELDLFEFQNILRRKYGLTKEETKRKIKEYITAISKILCALDFFVNDFLKFSEKEKEQMVTHILERLTCNKQGLLELIIKWKKTCERFNVKPNVEWFEKIVKSVKVDNPRWGKLVDLSNQLSNNIEKFFEKLMVLDEINPETLLNFRYPPNAITLLINSYGLLRVSRKVLQKDMQERLMSELKEISDKIERFLLLHLFQEVPSQIKYLSAYLLLIKAAINMKFMWGNYEALSKRAITLASEFIGLNKTRKLYNLLVSKIKS